MIACCGSGIGWDYATLRLTCRKCGKDVTAQGIEAGTAETVEQGSVNESPVERSSLRPNDTAQPPQDNIS
jgi:hypothetical protein